jgi:two-component system sensor histidine kinase RpfC
MTARSARHREGWLARCLAIVRARLAGRGDSEHEQAIIRVAIMAGIALYFQAFGWIADGVAFNTGPGALLAASHTVFAVAIFAWIVIAPRVHPTRRYVGMVGDIAALSIALVLEGEHASHLFLLYLWVTLGNGFRYGLRELWAAVTISALAFAAVIAITPFWQHILQLSLGLLVLIVVIPAYSATLIRRLYQAKAQAESASAAKGRFVANVSHELRTPLNAIIGIGDILDQSNLNADQHDMLSTLRSAGRSLLSMIEEILDFSRLDAGRMPSEPVAFDLHRGMGELHALLRPQAAAKGLRLALHVDPAVPADVVGDWNNLRRIVTNLVANAIKFTDAGFVLIDIGVAAGAGTERQTLRIAVVDTGIGIAPDARARIFESFTQADDAVNRRYGGTGLGLAIVRQLCELLGGAITVESELGRGSIFTLELPLSVVHGADRPEALRGAPSLMVLSADAYAFTDIIRPLAGTGVMPRLAQNELQARHMLEDEAPAWRHGIVAIDGRGLGEVEAIGIADRLARLRGPEDLRFILLYPAMGLTASAELKTRYLGFVDPAREPEALTALLGAATAMVPGSPIFARGPGVALPPLGTGLPSPPEPEISGRILVAEDNPINRKVIGRMLENAGHRVAFAENGDEALDLLEAGNIDLLVLDINMPGMSGIDVVKLYRMSRLGDETEVPIVALSADATAATREECLRSGCKAFLTKPVESALLLGTVGELLAAGVERRTFTIPLTASPLAAAGEPAPPSEPADPFDDEAEAPGTVTNIAAHPRFQPGASGHVIDRAALAALESLDMTGDFVTEVIGEYLSDARQLLDTLRRAVEEGDLKAFLDTVHALRSSSANVGAQHLHQICSELAGTTRPRLDQMGRTYVEQIDREFERYARAIGRYLAAVDRNRTR